MTPFLQTVLGVCLIVLSLAAIGWLGFVAYLRFRVERRRDRVQEHRSQLLGGFVNDADGALADVEEAANEAALRARARVLRQHERIT